MKQIHHLYAITFSILIAVLVGGCMKSNVATLPLDNPATGMSIHNGLLTAGRQLWGIWDIAIDPVSGDFEVVPARFSEFHANVRKFLEESPCKNCLKVVPPIVTKPYGMDVTISITHPFPETLITAVSMSVEYACSTGFIISHFPHT